MVGLFRILQPVIDIYLQWISIPQTGVEVRAAWGWRGVWSLHSGDPSRLKTFSITSKVLQHWCAEQSWRWETLPALKFWLKEASLHSLLGLSVISQLASRPLFSMFGPIVCGSNRSRTQIWCCVWTSYPPWVNCFPSFVRSEDQCVAEICCTSYELKLRCSRNIPPGHKSHFSYLHELEHPMLISVSCCFLHNKCAVI